MKCAFHFPLQILFCIECVFRFPLQILLVKETVFDFAEQFNLPLNVFLLWVPGFICHGMCALLWGVFSIECVFYWGSTCYLSLNVCFIVGSRFYLAWNVCFIGVPGVICHGMCVLLWVPSFICHGMCVLLWFRTFISHLTFVSLPSTNFCGRGMCVLPLRIYLLTYLLIYLLTPWNTVLLEKLIGFQLVKKFSAFYGTLKVHCRSQKCPPPVPILSQLDPVHTPTSHILTIEILFRI